MATPEELFQQWLEKNAGGTQGKAPIIEWVTLPDGRKIAKQYDPDTKTWIDAQGLSVAGPPSPSVANQTAQWSIQTGKDGRKYRVNEITGQAVPLEGFDATSQTEKWTDPRDGSQWIINSATGERIKQLSEAIPGFRPSGVPAGPAPRTAEALAMDQLGVANAGLSLQANQRNQFGDLGAQSQYHTQNIDRIKQMLADNQIDESQANRLLSMSRQNLGAAAQGTDPWSYETNRQKLSSDLLGDQYTRGMGLAPTLTKYALDLYSNILPNTGAAYNFDPVAEARRWQREMNPAPELTPLAKAVMQGALGGQ